MQSDKRESPMGVSVADAAHIAGWSTAWVYNRVADGRLDAQRIGRRLFITVADLERLIDRERQEPNSTSLWRLGTDRHQLALRRRRAFRLVINNTK